ncbi:MAG: hypothetical protein IT425_04685 [Pirellulales bacterium]|nr:hypothetical protein [Pirellulales bacterium]
MANQIRLDLSVLIYREDEFWIAHCLETDLVGEGATDQEAMRSLIDISNIQIESALETGNLASIFSPAPPELWQSYAIARQKKSVRPKRKLSSVNRLRIRELAMA